MSLLKVLSNVPGWKTNKKLLIIESDDWGSIRMPSLKTFESLKQMGINVDGGNSSRYNTIDTLASAEDLEVLFNCLSKHKDKNGNSPVFTAISLTSNPDFERIKKSSFTEYFFEPFTTTLVREGKEKAFQLWKEGNSSKLFVPELHGREHLNVVAWMRALQNNDKETKYAFENGFWGFKRKKKSYEVNFQGAFDLEENEDSIPQEKILKSAVEEFTKLHGKRPRYFVPPNGPFSNKLLPVLKDSKIEYLSTPKVQHEPLGRGKIRKKYRYLGMSSENGIKYITRNCFFEPNHKGKGFDIDSCKKEIAIAFALKKPAVISTHRTNYIGGLNEQNRKESIAKLNQLLGDLIKKYPDIEFITSTELGDLL